MNPFVISPSTNKEALISSTTASSVPSVLSSLDHTSPISDRNPTSNSSSTSISNNITSSCEYSISNTSTTSPPSYSSKSSSSINNNTSSSSLSNNNHKIISFEHLIRPPAPKFHQDHSGYSPNRSTSTSSSASASSTSSNTHNNSNNMSSSSTTTATITTPTYSPTTNSAILSSHTSSSSNTSHNSNVHYSTSNVQTPPPQFHRHNTYSNDFYNSSSFSDSSMISSSASTNSSLSSSPRLGLMNYSPKHSRKISSSSINRNMKNLSLNLNGGNSNSKSKQQYLATGINTNGYHSNSSSLDSNMTTSSISSPSFVSKPSTTSRKLSLSIPLDLNNPNISSGATTATIIQHHPSASSSSSTTTTTTTTTVITPSVTKTPALPPLIPRQKSHTVSDIEISNKNGIAFKFPSKDNNYYSNINDLLDTYQGSTPLDQQQYDYLQHQQEASVNNKLKSPLILNGSTPTTTTINTVLNDELQNATLDDIDDETVNTTTQYQLSTPLHLQRSHSYPSNDYNPNMISLESSGNSTFQHIPEELQESNQLDAYPIGPRNVLNNQIYLYSDPKGDVKVDINDYDLIINVAKECQNLSSQFSNQKLDVKEYQFYPWSHTTSISKSLLAITTKMETFDSKGLKILVHCQCGVSRSASVIVAYFMYKFNIGVNEAYELLKSGTDNIEQPINRTIGEKGNHIEACDKICPNMSLIFELMEFGDILKAHTGN